MTHLDYILATAIVLTLIAAVLVAGALYRLRCHLPPEQPDGSKSDSATTYRIQPLMTGWESRVFGELLPLLPVGWHLCPQVRAADLVQIEAGSAGERQAALNKLAPRSIDFVLIDQHRMPRLAIELDDGSHYRPRRRRRDADIDQALAGAGIPITHIQPYQPADWPAIIRGLIVGADATPQGNHHEQA